LGPLRGPFSSNSIIAYQDKRLDEEQYIKEAEKDSSLVCLEGDKEISGKQTMKEKKSINKPITDAEKQKIIKLLKEKRNAAEVGRIVGKSQRSVCRIAVKNKIPLKRKRLSISPKEKKKIIELLKEKGNAAEVGRIVGRPQRSVYNIAAENKIPLKRKYLSIFPVEEEKILKLLKEKKNGTAVGKIVGRARSTVCLLAKKHNIKITKRPRKKKIQR